MDIPNQWTVDTLPCWSIEQHQHGDFCHGRNSRLSSHGGSGQDRRGLAAHAPWRASQQWATGSRSDPWSRGGGLLHSWWRCSCGRALLVCGYFRVYRPRQRGAGAKASAVLGGATSLLKRLVLLPWAWEVGGGVSTTAGWPTRCGVAACGSPRSPRGAGRCHPGWCCNVRFVRPQVAWATLVLLGDSLWSE